MRKLLAITALFCSVIVAHAQYGGDKSYVSGAASQVATPSFSPGGGSYSSTQTVTISTATSLAVLCYTTDGSTPTESGHLCSGGTTSTYSTPISVATTQTVKAIGTKATYTDSAVGSATYTIASCTAPTSNFTNIWSAPSMTGNNYCGALGTTACTTSGQIAHAIPELVAANTATSTGAIAEYYPSEVNGLAALGTWGTNQYFYFTPTTSIPSTATAYTYYAIFYQSGSSGYQDFFGSTNGTMPQFYDDSGYLVARAGNGAIGGTLLISNYSSYPSPAGWQMAVFTYVPSTGAAALYTLASGSTFVAQATATQTATLSAGTTALGNFYGGNSSGNFVAELGWTNSALTQSQLNSELAPWAVCKYGL